MNVKRYGFGLFVILLSLGFLYTSAELHAGVTGKISGRVVEKDTGEPMPGVNMVLEGTTLGAATDVNGAYFILNVPPGVYSLRSSFIGYKTVTQTDVQVQVDLTTQVDFQLETSAISGEEVTIVSERPAVELDVTGSSYSINAQAIERAPVRGVRDAMKQQSGFSDTGETTYVRGGLATELNYRVDGISLNSGLLSDNWQRLNTTAVAEISVLTGGYNAEYGSAMSGVVNVVSKEASVLKRGVEGQTQYHIRPAGQYHWGKNMYDTSLWKTTNFGLDHWQQQLQDPAQQAAFAAYFQRFYGWDGSQVPTAQQLLDTYSEQITPDPILGDYTKRPQHEIEGTLIGSPVDKVSVLLSGRYLRGVNIFPQSNKYNPEYNLQGKVNYHFSSTKKLTLNLLRGWYNSSTYTESNWNNFESSQEARWQPNADVRSPYDDKAYAPWGGYWLKGPQEKAVNMAGLQWKHTLSPSTFYEVELSYFSDKMTELQEYDKLNTSTVTVPWGDSWFDLAGNFRLEARQIQVNNYTDAKVLTLRSDLTSQLNRSHQLKTGLGFKRYDVDYQHYYMEFPAGDVWHLDNVFAGTPVEGSIYAQDKMEFRGMIVNLGLRVDAFNTLSDYAENIYDPLGFETVNGGNGLAPTNTSPIWQANQPGYDWFAYRSDYRSAFDGVRNDRQTVSSEWKVALSPRIGFSFPITDVSKLRFSYGHFNQRPSWAKLMGFPTSWYDSAPYESVRMDQWQGWYGQPGLTYERTIQYELGFTQSLFDVFGLDIAGYYKDASGLTRFSHNSTYNRNGGSFASVGWGSGNVETESRARNLANDGHDNIFYTNNAFKDIRGVEVSLEKRYSSRWMARISADYSTSTGGAAGYSWYREDASQINQPASFDETNATWLSSYILKGNLNYVTPTNLANGILGDVSISLFHEYYAGPQYTWYPKDYTGIQEPNNKRWSPHQKTDLKLNKRFDIGSTTPWIGLEVFNLFNKHDLIIPGGSDLDDWQETGAIPKLAESGEENIWFFYNSISNPKRMVYLTVGVEF